MIGVGEPVDVGANGERDTVESKSSAQMIQKNDKIRDKEIKQIRKFWGLSRIQF